MIPTVVFDASKHVIAGRESSEGREVWFTLSALVDAERPLEAQYESVALDQIRREIDALKAQPLNTVDLERRLVQMFENFTPPPALTQETAAILTDLTQAVLQLKKDHAETVRRLENLTLSVVAVGEKLGV